MSDYHVPVLLQPTIELLDINPGGVYFDGTAGGGGHSSAILQHIESGLLISCDRDPQAIAEVTRRLGQGEHNRIVHDEFSNISAILDRLEIDGVDGVLLDIGVSSHQLDCAERGFSYHNDAPLDMRMASEGRTAADLVAELSWQELAAIFSRYGEEKHSVRIAKAICRERESEPIRTTLQLADIIRPQRQERMAGADAELPVFLMGMGRRIFPNADFHIVSFLSADSESSPGGIPAGAAAGRSPA